MCNQQEKLPIFAFTLKSLVELQLQYENGDSGLEKKDSEKYSTEDYNRALKSFSNTRIMKLLYFTCLESVTEKEGKIENIGLFEYFDNFRAYDRGPVEVDIYMLLSKISGFLYEAGQYVAINMDEIKSVVSQISPNVRNMVENAVAKLKEKFSKEIFTNTQKLVDRAHQLPLWNYARVVEGNKMDINLNVLNLEKAEYMRLA